MNKRVVIVGGGFAGLAAAKSLARAPVDVVLIDKQNHHLFQPLLYQVATAALSPADIAWPIRRILRRQKNVQVTMADVTGIDVVHRKVEMSDKSEPYDYLVLATGATHAYFGHDDWAPYAPGLKQIADATEIRRRILVAFEKAEIESVAKVREGLLTFVIVGGGPTGVEMAGAVAELARKALSTDFRRIDPRTTRVILLEAGPQLLPSFSPALAAYAGRALDRLGIEVQLNSPVTHCGPTGVRVGNNEITAATIIWAAGVAASAAANWLDTEKDGNNRVRVGSRLEAPGHDDVFAVGDTALCVDVNDQALPGTAAVAKQQGAYVGKLIAARSQKKADPDEFRYRSVGELATIGRGAALADLGWIRIKGRLAWWFWGMVHIYFLINTRSRLLVATQWLWSYLTFDRGARLIVRDE